jgi:enoyl-CoA hydratase
MTARALAYTPNDPRLAQSEHQPTGDIFMDPWLAGDGSGILGTPDDCIEQLNLLQAAGVEQVLLTGVLKGDLRSVCAGGHAGGRMSAWRWGNNAGPKTAHRRRVAMSTYQFLDVERLEDGKITRVMLNRPKQRNAQNRGLLVELDEALLEAEADDDVRVVILGGMGPMFSAGHDMGSSESLLERQPGPNQHQTARDFGGHKGGLEQRMRQEWHFYFTNTLRWRNLRKWTIAQVHGKCYAAGLMLAWACDTIVAAEGTEFAEVVGTRLGMCGLEYFGHPWEFGPRKAKELLVTGDSISAEEAFRLGMVSKVFPAHRLAEDTLTLARRIAQLPTVTSLLIKESVNQTVDNMGFYNAIQACFSIHQMNHAHWAEVTGGTAIATPEFGIPTWQTAPPVKAAVMVTP